MNVAAGACGDGLRRVRNGVATEVNMRGRHERRA